VRLLQTASLRSSLTQYTCRHQNVAGKTTTPSPKGRTPDAGLSKYHLATADTMHSGFQHRRPNGVIYTVTCFVGAANTEIESALNEDTIYYDKKTRSQCRIKHVRGP